MSIEMPEGVVLTPDELREMFMGNRGQVDEADEKDRLSVTEQLEVLERYAKRVTREKPFQLFEVIIPRKDANQRWNDHPHLVIETRYDDPVRNFETADPTDTSATRFGCILDLRVALCMHGRILKFWVESTDFEKFERN